MYLLYSLALSLLSVALLPYFLYQALRHGKYAGSLKERMGRLPESLRGDGRQAVWVHAVSVGEYLAARPIIERLRSEMPGSRLVISTTTLTARRLAGSDSHRFDGLFYFPFDWQFTARRALAWVKPSIVIIIETEIWPNFLRECRRRGVITMLANGRISPRSFKRYRRVRPFIRRAIGDFSMMIMQSEADQERARELGARASRVRTCGNLKYDLMGVGGQGSGVGGQTRRTTSEEDSNFQSPTPNPQTPNPNPQPPLHDPCEEIDHRFALSSSPHLIVAGSTAPGEEDMLVEALRQVRGRRGLEDARLLVAPRHPERFDEVAMLLARSGFSFARRSQAARSSAAEVSAPRADLSIESELDADVILLDTIGELASVYRFAAVVFVGGSLVPRGGHNIIEPAAFGKPVVVGPHTENFRQIVSDFARAGAVVQIAGAAEDGASMLVRELIRLLSDREEAREIGSRARRILLANRGATDCTLAAIKEVLSKEK